MARARRDFERPPAEQVAALARHGTALLSDAQDRSRAMHARIHAIGTTRRVAGPALTVRIYPNDNFMCHVAVALAQPGDVLVIDADNYQSAAVWGEMLSRAALARGVAAVVVDGAVRDRAAIAELGLPVYATAVVPRGTHKRHAGDANLPVSCGELTVAPGDVVVADEDGVVVVPRDQIAAVIERAHQHEVREQGWRDALAAGKSMYEIAGIEAMLAASGIKWE